MEARLWCERPHRADDPAAAQLLLIRSFAMAEYRQLLREQPTRGALVRFHSRHKHLLLACDEPRLRRMGPLVAASAERPLEVILREYGQMLDAALRRTPGRSSTINALQHALGYFKNRISTREKNHFLSLLEEYRLRRLPFSALSTLLWSWVLRFEERYLSSQSFYRPYPRISSWP